MVRATGTREPREGFLEEGARIPTPLPEGGENNVGLSTGHLGSVLPGGSIHGGGGVQGEATPPEPILSPSSPSLGGLSCPFPLRGVEGAGCPWTGGDAQETGDVV